MCKHCQQIGNSYMPHKENECPLYEFYNCTCGLGNHDPNLCKHAPPTLPENYMPTLQMSPPSCGEVLYIPNKKAHIRAFLSFYNQQLEGRSYKNKQALEHFALRVLNYDRVIFT
jgi:hypothetical protein